MIPVFHKSQKHYAGPSLKLSGARHANFDYLYLDDGQTFIDDNVSIEF